MQLCCFQENPQVAIFCLAPRQAVAEKDDKKAHYTGCLLLPVQAAISLSAALRYIYTHTAKAKCLRTVHNSSKEQQKTKRTKSPRVKYWTAQGGQVLIEL